MMKLFAGGATTPLVVKIWTQQLGENWKFVSAVSRYLEAKFDYGYIIIFLVKFLATKETLAPLANNPIM